MALLDITEFQFLAQDLNYQTGFAGAEPALAEQQLSVTSSSAPSAAFQDSTRYVRVHSDVPCRIRFGIGVPVAVATDRRLAAGQTEYFGIRGGTTAQNLAMAVILTT